MLVIINFAERLSQEGMYNPMLIIIMGFWSGFLLNLFVFQSANNL